MSSPTSTSTPPGSEFGHQQPVLVGNHRYMVLGPSMSKSSSSQQPTNSNKPTTANKLNPKSTNTSLFPAPNVSKSATTDSDNDFDPIDPETGKERTSIHGIHIIKNPQTGNFTMIFPFPALLSPALAKQYSGMTLPEPTPGGTINLFLSNPDLGRLLALYKGYFTTIQQTRNALPYTHYFGIPLGPVNPICYDLGDGSEKRVVDRVEHYSEEGTSTSNYRFGTKFTSSETSQQLALNVVKMHQKMGLDTSHLLDMVVMKHDNYREHDNKLKTSSTTPNPEENPDSTNPTPTESDLHRAAAMPIPKLHCTMLLVKILSRDEFDLVSQQLSSLQQVIYDSLGGTSVSLRIQNIEAWAPAKEGTRSKHFVARVAEAFKEGKISAADHISTGGKATSASGFNGTGNSSTSKTTQSQNQKCPRLAMVTSILAHNLFKMGIMTVVDLNDQKIGLNQGQDVGVTWHMTLFNCKYASYQYPSAQNFLLDVSLCQKGANSIPDWGQHRAPCINLYRMGSKLAISPKLGLKLDPTGLYDTFPQRHKVKDHYTIDYSLPLP